MIHSSRRNRKSKVIAEVLAIIADTELATHRSPLYHEINGRLGGESAAEFVAALEKFHTERLIKLPKRRVI
ncbi:MAG TPA: hypothetical protein VLZ74_16780 [Methylocella sp.]|nr:hypothetical protein [Methylocella sp.]